MINLSTSRWPSTCSRSIKAPPARPRSSFSLEGETLGTSDDRVPAALPEARLGRARRATKFGSRVEASVSRRARGGEGRSETTIAAHRHHEPARDDARVGSQNGRADSPRDRVAVPAHRGRVRRAESRRARSRAFARRPGLVIDAYFSGTKIAWLLDNVSGARARAEKGELAFGTIDSFLVHRLTGGAVHVTDVTNASRTLLWTSRRSRGTTRCSALFRVPRERVCRTIVVERGDRRRRRAGRSDFCRDGIPIAGIAGDQQAALFGQACFARGRREMHVRHRRVRAHEHRQAKPIREQARPRHDGRVAASAARRTYALEGSAFIAGAAVQWLRDGLGLIKTARRDRGARARRSSRATASRSCPRSPGSARRTGIKMRAARSSGITRGTTAAHLARATLEGIAFEVPISSTR